MTNKPHHQPEITVTPILDNRSRNKTENDDKIFKISEEAGEVKK